jgi:hypothetical protein
MSLEHSQFTELARDLGRISSPQVRRNVEKAAEVSARNVKDGWNGKLYNEGHAKLTGRSISYDVGTAFDLGLGTSMQDAVEAGSGAAAVIAEIGPRRGSGKQAGVVLLLENGSVHNPPHGYGAAALAEEETGFEQGIDLALQSVEREAGLA